jgi:hypothetical protein
MGRSMKFKKRLEDLEKRAEYYLETMDNGDDEPEDRITFLARKVGSAGIARILREIDGKTRGLPSERE